MLNEKYSIKNTMPPKENITYEKAYAFAVRIVNCVRFIQETKKEYVLSKQLLKSGNSIGANVAESIGGISKADFSAKISIAYKECRETLYWLSLLKDTQYIDIPSFQSFTMMLKRSVKYYFPFSRKQELMLND